MSKEISPIYTNAEIAGFQTRQPIRAVDWRSIVSLQHHVYARHGERITGATFIPKFTTDSALWTQTPLHIEDEEARGLDTYQPVARFHKIYPGGDTFFGIKYYSKGIALLIELQNSAGDTLSFELENNTVDYKWVDGVITLPRTFLKGESDLHNIEIDIFAKKTISDPGELLQIDPYIFPQEFGEDLPNSEEDWLNPFFTREFGTSRTGATGMASISASSYYSGTTLEGEVTIIGDGIQQWTVPQTRTYRITANGSGFGGGLRDRGARMIGDFNLNEGDVLRIVVGQTGTNSRCGSGATFVTREVASGGEAMFDGQEVELLIAAGSNGGYANTTSPDNTISPNIGNNGKNSANITSGNGDGGTDGGGGGQGGSCFGQSGAGFRGDGVGCDGTVAQSFLNGSVGAIAQDGEEGGFGGGGTGRLTTDWRIGGGGGYSGGASAGNAEDSWGGGGGSFNIGDNQSNATRQNIGSGSVIIEEA